MICKIAELGVSVPELGDLPGRCKPYEAAIEPDIIIENIYADKWKDLSAEDNYYLDSGFQFYRKLLAYDGIMLHASAVVVDGLAYLFSGPCGMGKSTHTSMYRNTFPESVIINDDKPALRRINGKWMAYGTPWCGKDGINQNASAPIAGICFLHRGDTSLSRVKPVMAAAQFLNQTSARRFKECAPLIMKHINSIIQEVPIFDFYNHAQPGDEMITYEAMRDAALGKDK